MSISDERLAEIEGHAEAEHWRPNETLKEALRDLIATVREQAAEIEQLTMERDHWHKAADRRGEDLASVGDKYLKWIATILLERDLARAGLSRVEALAIRCSYHGDGLASLTCEGCATAMEARTNLRAALETGGER